MKAYTREFMGRILTEPNLLTEPDGSYTAVEMKGEEILEAICYGHVFYPKHEKLQWRLWFGYFGLEQGTLLGWQPTIGTYNQYTPFWYPSRENIASLIKSCVFYGGTVIMENE